MAGDVTNKKILISIEAQNTQVLTLFKSMEASLTQMASHFAKIATEMNNVTTAAKATTTAVQGTTVAQERQTEAVGKTNKAAKETDGIVKETTRSINVQAMAMQLAADKAKMMSEQLGKAYQLSKGDWNQVWQQASKMYSNQSYLDTQAFNKQRAHDLKMEEQAHQSAVRIAANRAKIMDNSMVQMRRKMLQFAAMGIGVAGIGGAIGTGMKFNIDIDQQTAAIGVMLKSQSAATALVQQLSGLQNQIGVGLMNSSKSAKEMLAYGIEAKDLVRTMTMLNTVGQAVNVTMDDMTYVYGTLKAQNRAYTRDIVQFAMRGIPIYEALSQVMGVPVEKLKELAKEGSITFKEVEKAFTYMTSSQGPFGGYLEKHMDTLKGKLQILGFEWQMFLGRMAQPMEAPFKNVVVATSSALSSNKGPPFSDNMGQAMNKLAPQIQQLMSSLLDLGEAVTALLSQIAGAAAGLIATFGPLISVLSKLISTLASPLTGALAVFLVGNSLKGAKKFLDDIIPVIKTTVPLLISAGREYIIMSAAMGTASTASLTMTAGMTSASAATAAMSGSVNGLKAALATLWDTPGAAFITSLAILAGVGVITYNIISGQKADTDAFKDKMKSDSDFARSSTSKYLQGSTVEKLINPSPMSFMWSTTLSELAHSAKNGSDSIKALEHDATALGTSMGLVASQAISMGIASDAVKKWFKNLTTPTYQGAYGPDYEKSKTDYNPQPWTLAFKAITGALPLFTVLQQAAKTPENVPRGGSGIYHGFYAPAGSLPADKAGVSAKSMFQDWADSSGFSSVTTRINELKTTEGPATATAYAKIMANSLETEMKKIIESLDASGLELAKMATPEGQAGLKLNTEAQNYFIQQLEVLRKMTITGPAPKKMPWEDSTALEEWKSKNTNTKIDDIAYQRARAIDSTKKEQYDEKFGPRGSTDALKMMNDIIKQIEKFYGKETSMQNLTDSSEFNSAQAQLTKDELLMSRDKYRTEMDILWLQYDHSASWDETIYQTKLKVVQMLADKEEKAILAKRGDTANSLALMGSTKSGSYERSVGEVANTYEAAKRSADAIDDLNQRLLANKTATEIYTKATQDLALSQSDSLDVASTLRNTTADTQARDRAVAFDMLSSATAKAAADNDLVKGYIDGKKATEAYNAAIKKLNQDMFSDQTGGFFTKLSGAYGTQAGSDFDASKTGATPLKRVGSFASGLGNTFMAGLTSTPTGAALVSVTGQLAAVLGNATSNIGAFVMTIPGLQDAFDALGTVLKPAVDWISSSLDSMMKPIGEMGNGVIGGIDTLLNGGTKPEEGKGAVAGIMQGAAGGPIGVLVALLVHSLGPLIDAMQPLTDALLPLVTTVANVLKPAFKALGAVITWISDNVFVPFGNFIIWIINAVIDAINAALGWLGVHIQRLDYLQTSDQLKKAGEAAALLTDQLSGTVGYLKNKINSQFDSIIKSLGDALNVGAISVGEYQTQVADVNRRRNKAITPETVLTPEQMQVTDMATLIQMYKDAIFQQEKVKNGQNIVDAVTELQSKFSQDISDLSAAILARAQDTMSLSKLAQFAIRDLTPKTTYIGSDGMAHQGAEELQYKALLDQIIAARSAGDYALLAKLLDQAGYSSASLPTKAPKGNKGYASGTSNLPYDQIAQVHKGEGIIPADFMSSIRSGELSLSGRGNSTNNSPNVIVNVTVQGSVQTEKDLAASIAVEIARQRRIGALTV